MIPVLLLMVLTQSLPVLEKIPVVQNIVHYSAQGQTPEVWRIYLGVSSWYDELWWYDLNAFIVISSVNTAAQVCRPVNTKDRKCVVRTICASAFS